MTRECLKTIEKLVSRELVVDNYGDYRNEDEGAVFSKRCGDSIYSSRCLLGGVFFRGVRLLLQRWKRELGMLTERQDEQGAVGV